MGRPSVDIPVDADHNPAVTHVRRSAPIPLILAVAAAPTTRPTTTFDSREYGFKLKVPAGWIVPDRPDEGQVFTAWLPLRAGPATGPATRPTGVLRVGGAGLRVEQGRAGVPDGQLVRDLTGLMAANLFADDRLGAKHVALRAAKVADLPARQVRFVVDQGHGPVTVVYVVAAHNGVEYVFNAAAPSDQFDALWPDLAALFASFDLRE